MWRLTSLCRLVVLALLLALPCGGLLAPAWSGVTQVDDPPGAPPGHAPMVRAAVPPVPDGLGDVLQPLHDAAPSVMPRARVFDGEEAPLLQSVTRTALWERLAAVPPVQRPDIGIEAELGAGAGPADRLAAARVAEAWSAGRFDEAIAVLRALEESGGACALGISWKGGATPAAGLATAAAAAGGTDVRIGDRVGGRIACLDFDPTTGYLFAVLCWGPLTGGDAYWTVHRSTDGGATWTETYAWHSLVGIGDVSATVVGGYLYVGYLVGNATNELRLRRCLIPSGAPDIMYGFQVVLDAAPATFNEICLASNADNYDNRIYCVGLRSDHALRFAWDESGDGTTFTEQSPPVADASFGLDVTWNPDGPSGRFIFISYAGTDGRLHVQYYVGTGWTDLNVTTSSGMDHRSSVSAYRDAVICAYEYDYAEGRGIRYSITYDAGDIWNVGDIAVPDGMTVASYMCPEVEARGGYGTGIVYAAEVGEPDRVYYRKRAGYAPGLWDGPDQFNDYDTSTGSRLALAHVPVLGPTCFSHGAIYFYNGIPYFDLPMLGTVDVSPPVAAQGVQLSPPTPSPFTDRASVRLTLPQAGQVRLDVFNVQGRHVATLADGPMEAGTHSFALDGRGLGSGVYFCRLTAGPEQRTSRFVVIR